MDDALKGMIEEVRDQINQVKKYGTWEYYFDLLMSCPKVEEAIKNIKALCWS